jgi:hypothetical protein
MGKISQSKKSYSSFTFDDLSALNLKVIEKPLFSDITIPPVEPTDFLKKTLERNMKLKLRSEKAKSELIIMPILVEMVDINAQSFACFSGYKFNVEPKLGLNGFCDYLLSLEPESLVISAPVFCIVEAKNDNLDEGIPQCIAEMYAAQLYNQKKGKPIHAIFGAVTFGFEWKFLQLVDNVALADTNVYYFTQLPQILGILQHIIDVSQK